MKFLQTTLTASLLAIAVNSNAAVIDFNDGTNGSAIGSFYSSQGVTFSNAAWDSFVSPDEASVGAGGLKLVSIIDEYVNKSNNPIVASFSSAINAFSIYGLNVGENGARIEAYDQSGGLLGFDEAFGVSTGVDNHPFLSVSSSSDIYSIHLFQPASAITEGMLWDNMSYTISAVPEPSTYALMLGGLGLVGFMATRRKKQQA